MLEEHSVPYDNQTCNRYIYSLEQDSWPTIHSTRRQENR